MYWLYALFEEYQIIFLNQFYGHIKVSIYIYAVLKYVAKCTTSNKTILKVLALIISPIAFTIIWILKITKTLVAHWIAYIDSDYVSMLDGTETIFIAQATKENRPIITTLFLLESNQTQELTGDDYYTFCVDNISRVFQTEKFLKLQCSVRYKLGYFYFKKEHWPVQQCIEVIDCTNDCNMNDISYNSYNKPGKTTLTMEQLRVYVSQISNTEMPQNGDCLWEARIAKQKLSGTNLYPLIFRFHHILGDGVTLFNMFTVDFQKNHISQLKPATRSILRPLDATYTHNPHVTMTGLADPPDSNVLCQTSGNKHIVWFTEQKPQILETIKEIKQKRTNITAVDVILTCFLESLTSHFNKSNTWLPEVVYTVLPMMPPNMKYTEYGSVTNYKMSNKISLGFLRLPLQLNEKDERTSLLKRLELIKHEYNVFKNVSLDYWCNRWQGTVVLTLLPWFIQKWFVSKFGTSLMVSNIPGCKKLVFFGTLKVKELVVIDPNFSISGVSLIVTSYEDRLNFAYTIDQCVISNVDDVKQISMDFIKNIEALNEGVP